MRIAIFGAGAVGCHLAVRLGRAGHDVSVVARGTQQSAIARDGLMLESGDERLSFSPRVSDIAAELGPQDAVLVTLKAYAQPAAAQAIGDLLGAETPVVFVQNGIPWWLPLAPVPVSGATGATLPLPWPDLEYLDPHGELRAVIGGTRVLGGVVTSANSIIAPGIVRADPPRRPRLAIGEIDGGKTARIDELRQVLEGAGIESPPVSDITSEMWRKLVLNLSASSLALLTERHSSVVREEPAIGTLSRAIITEIEAVAMACGADLGNMAARAEQILSQAPDRQPSLLQDRIAGRTLEVDSLFRAPQSIARARGVETPVFDVVVALVSALAAGREQAR